MPLSSDRDADTGAGGTAGGGGADLVEADRQVGDVERALVVEPEDRVVRDDEIDGVAPGERVDLILGQTAAMVSKSARRCSTPVGMDPVRRRRLLGLYRR